MSVPYKILYNNDFTNATTCIWQFHRRSQPFDPSMLEATIREVAGLADAHFLQLATGRVPWYQSKIYSMEDHRKWWCEHFGVSPDDPIFTTGYHGYLLAGNDPLRDFIGYCKKYGQAAFVSMRMNDTHGLELVDEPGNKAYCNCISRFYAEHPEYRLSQGKGWYERGLNWIYPEVRTSLLELIQEQVSNYDLDGFELDFQRHPRFFVEEKTTAQEREQIMFSFLCEVRKMLDQNPRGKRMYLSVRIPCYLSMLEDCGLNPSLFGKAGVDMAVISDHYFASLDTEFAQIAGLLGSVPAYCEMCHTTYTGKNVGIIPGQHNTDTFTFRRTTPEQYRTIANVAYHHGAAGVSFFNFAYYREHGTDGRGPFAEPPFAVIGECRDPDALSKGAQDYLLTPGWSCWAGGYSPITKIKNKNLPRVMEPQKEELFHIEMFLQSNPKETVTRLRIQADSILTNQRFEVKLNGVALDPTEDVSEPFGIQYPPLLGPDGAMRAFLIPLELIREGKNEICIKMTEGESIRLISLNIAIR